MADYIDRFTEDLERFNDLRRKRDGIEAQMLRLRRLLQTSHPFLTGKQQMQLETQFRSAVNAPMSQQKELTAAIKHLLTSNSDQWFGPTNVRDALERSGFDFSHYTSNPLSSVHSVLKRLAHKNVETRMVGRTTEYQWPKRFVRSKKTTR